MDDDWSTFGDTGGGDFIDSGDGAPIGNLFQLAQQFTPPGTFQGGGGPVVTQTAGVGGVIAGAGAVAVTLGARLAAMFGRSAGSFVLNGVKGSMASLWPMVRKYGPTAVATALGVSIGQLGQLLTAAPTTKRGRRRGISSRDIRTTKRVIRFNKRLTAALGTGHSYTRRSFGRGRGTQIIDVK